MKKVMMLIILLMLMLITALSVSAESGETLDFNEDELIGAIPDDAGKLLSDNGITADNGGVLGLSIDKILGGIWDTFRMNITQPLKLLLSLIGVIMLCAAAQALSDNGTSEMHRIFSVVAVLAGSGMIITCINELMQKVILLMTAAGSFTLTFIPIFSGVIATSGHITTASVFNSVVLGACTLFSQLCTNFLVPLTSCILGMSITGSIHPELNIEKIGTFLQRAITWALGLLATIFMGLLSLQTFVTVSADNLAIKAAKYAITSAVPIIGGTVSEAVNTMQGSISVLKNSIGTFGIAAGIAIIFPTLAMVLCYKLAVCTGKAVADIFGVAPLSAVLKSTDSVITIILAILVCFTLMTTVSVVLMLVMGMGLG